MKGFVDRLDEINTLADQSPGFIWRMQTEEGDSTAIQAYEDPSIIVNMSVWKDFESLENYVYKTVHVELIRGKKSWFSKMETAHQALWWIPSSHIPSLSEGKKKLECLQKNGASIEAFTFAKRFFPEKNSVISQASD
jgi:Domain of unknown function (DUF3291)